MLTGNEADKPVKRCEDLARPVKEDMEGWGVHVFSATMEGELDVNSMAKVK